MDLHILNKEQKIAVEHQKGPLLVLSGAGTGKTRVLTSRFVYIVKNLKFDFHRIIAVTFTNKAANEIKERVKKALDQKKDTQTLGQALREARGHKSFIYLWKREEWKYYSCKNS